MNNNNNTNELSIKELIKKYDLMPLRKVREYNGVFTGKMVKPLPDNENKLNVSIKEIK